MDLTPPGHTAPLGEGGVPAQSYSTVLLGQCQMAHTPQRDE